tara:strand:- start:502 stop:1050 length:549 start_codon:yes stop_codon:yes gene_type:complete
MQDRAYRIGQKKDTEIYRLISEKSVEEKQYQRQIYKQQMANVGMENSHEKRHFTGVLGMEKGELFGLVNLFADMEQGIEVDKVHNLTTRNIVQRTNSRYEGIRVEQVDEGSSKGSNVEGISKDMETLFGAEEEKKGSEALLHIAGASYTHNHNAIVGEDDVERAFATKVNTSLDEDMHIFSF